MNGFKWSIHQIICSKFLGYLLFQLRKDWNVSLVDFGKNNIEVHPTPLFMQLTPITSKKKKKVCTWQTIVTLYVNILFSERKINSSNL